MVFDIESFYPSISKNLFIKVIQFAKQVTKITDEDINLIMQTTKKEGNVDFDVPVGCFDDAEVCELVGNHILQQISQLFEHHSVGLYRDDGLAILKGLSGPEIGRVKKKVIKVFKRL